MLCDHFAADLEAPNPFGGAPIIETLDSQISAFSLLIPSDSRRLHSRIHFCTTEDDEQVEKPVR